MNKNFRKISDAWNADPAFTEEYERIGPDMDLAFTLAEARNAAGITQAELARRMGTSQAAIARGESGRMKPKWETVERYASALGKKAIVRLVAPALLRELSGRREQSWSDWQRNK